MMDGTTLPGRVLQGLLLLSLCLWGLILPPTHQAGGNKSNEGFLSTLDMAGYVLNTITPCVT